MDAYKWSQLQPLWNYLEKNYPNRWIADIWIDWKMMKFAPPSTRSLYEKIDKQITNYDEDIDWNWAKVQQEILPLFDNPHAIIRAGAAKITGLLFSEQTLIDDIPNLIEFLDYIKDKECSHGGILGPFIQGLDSIMGLYSLTDIPEIPKANIHLREWILNILEKSKPEPLYPNAQSLAFYVHEYFEEDPEAVKRLLAMGREELAVETATNVYGKVEGMEPVLKQLTKLKNMHLSKWAYEHLKKYY